MPDQQPNLPSAFNPFDWRPPREMFARRGYVPPAPATLSDRQLPGRLWELVYAAAARNFYFNTSNHLSDRGFYTLLHDEWLADPTADLPPGMEWNCTIAISEFNAFGASYEDTFLRHYASEAERRNWQARHPGKTLPPFEAPRYDRDRYLPAPAVSLDAHAVEPNAPPTLTEESGALGLPPVQDTLATEPENWTPPAKQLAEKHIPLLPPAEVTDDTLTPILWELLHNLALQGFYLLHTDHLSDRELYTQLWTRGLRDPAYLPGRNTRSGWFHDFLGAATETEMMIWLRFYASDEERTDHAKEYPHITIPPRERPPFNRDWRLPKGPF